MLIYIVEDDTDIRELESYAMKSSGYEVQSFGESKSFFKACQRLTNASVSHPVREDSLLYSNFCHPSVAWLSIYELTLY